PRPSVLSPVTVTLASTGAGAKFFSDTACTTQVMSVAIPAGMSQVTLSYSHTGAGMPTVRAQDSNMAFAAGTETPTVTAAAASKLQFAAQPLTSTAGQSIAGMVRVEVADTYGNRVTTSTAPITLAL